METVKDAVAESLEAAGMWRRAATRWLAVMNSPTNTTAQLEWLRMRRTYCRRQLMLPSTQQKSTTVPQQHTC